MQFRRRRRAATFTFTAKEGVKPTKDGVDGGARRRPGSTNPKVTINGQRRHGHGRRSCPPSPMQKVAAALAKYAGTNAERRQHLDRRADVGSRGQPEGAQGAASSSSSCSRSTSSSASSGRWRSSAIVAVIHDIIFTIGVYALFQFQVTPATVTAFLTILGFSLYDTVVVFDKVAREPTLAHRDRPLDLRRDGEPSLNAVLMRSLSTSLVALLPVLSLLIVGSGIFGATALEDFALALAAGLFIGSYSSIFVAAPLLAWWKEREPQYRALAERRRRVPGAAASASVGVPAVAPTTADDRDACRRRPGPPAVPRRDPSRAADDAATSRAYRAVAARPRRPSQPASPPAAAARERSSHAAEREQQQHHGTPGGQWIPPRCRSTCATSPTSRSRGSSSATSRRCSPRPTPSRATVDALGRAVRRRARSTRCSGSRPAGFVFAAPVAYRRGAGFVPVRKAGKLPWEIEREEYELEYGTDLLEIHRDAVQPGERVLIVDDVIATGGTAAATARLVERLGGDGRRLHVRARARLPRRPRPARRLPTSTRWSRMSERTRRPR